MIIKKYILSNNNNNNSNNDFLIKKERFFKINIFNFIFLIRQEIKKILILLIKIILYSFLFFSFILLFSIITIKLKLFFLHFFLINIFLNLILYIFRFLRIISNITSLFSSVLYIPKLSIFIEKFLLPDFFYLNFEQLDLLIDNIKKNKFWILFFNSLNYQIKKDITSLFYSNLYRIFYISYLYFYKYYRGFYSFSDIIFASEEDFIYFIYNYLYFSNKFVNLPYL